MKKIFMLFFVIGFLCPFARAQTSMGGLMAIDTVKVRCLYRQRFVMDTLDAKKKTVDLMLLDIGAHASKYHSYYMDLKDSVLAVLMSQNLSQTEIANAIVKMRRGSRVVDYTVLKNYPTGKLTLIDFFGGESMAYEEAMPTIQWTLKNDTATVCGYLCKKATSAFYGRNYEVWYAPEIPLREGPWKLCGLPGLILKAKDDQSYFSFECTAIEIPMPVKLIKVSKSLMENRKLKKADYNDAKQRFLDNAGAYLTGNPLYTGTLPSHNYEKKPYNPIERIE